jgi:hypothetical protein
MGKAKVDLNSVTTVGLDLAKHVFQIHAVDADDKIVIAKCGGAKTCCPSLTLYRPATTRSLSSWILAVMGSSARSANETSVTEPDLQSARR